MSSSLVQALRSDRCGSDPVRVVRPVFLDEGFPWNAVRVPVQHQWPVPDEWDHLGCHGEIVSDDVGLGDSFFLPHWLVKVGERELLPIDLNYFFNPSQQSSLRSRRSCCNTVNCPRVILLFDEFGNRPVLKGWDEDFAASSDLEGCD